MQHDLPHGADTAAPPSPAAARPYHLRLLDSAPAELSAQVLACVEHGRGRATDDDPRRIRVETPLLAGSGVELWESPLPVRHGRDEAIGYAENGLVLFGQLHLDEPALADIERASFDAYARIERFLQQRGFPHWLRVWNFLSDITGGSGDAERYRQFTVGRHRALSLKSGFERELPAATAIGTRDGGLLIWFIAGTTPGTQIENPRQVSAFRYPRQYGPKSPSFSRAKFLRWQGDAELLVSGTASIVGHETLHPDSPLAQLDETLANVEALLGQAAADTPLQPELVKLYLRQAEHLPQVQGRLLSHFGAATPCMVLQGDVCRAELDVEIEAIFRATT
ncbi:pteridine-dependent deoxygenase [Solimonas terrae]|uniref:Pteridine-dependent deoxygenase n=1 Tax=Solimonas terrae TaxID=1396819 RepID=A0A6M2BVI2_9GAMM|nr:pteridine-dependent deoxygenase [Solimonas terrae]NGY06566.1 pteridine-dependent deoxygenase [Solimonas terrae]